MNHRGKKVLDDLTIVPEEVPGLQRREETSDRNFREESGWNVSRKPICGSSEGNKNENGCSVRFKYFNSNQPRLEFRMERRNHQGEE